MADSYIAIDEPAVVDKKLDTEQITVGANTVERERFIIAGVSATDIVKPVAQDAVDIGNPLPIGGLASSATPSAMSADGDRVKAWFTLSGALNVADAGGTLSVDDGAGSLTVDGTVTANLAAGVNNIGDVDVLTVNGVAPAFGTGVRAATVQRVTIATDDLVPVSDNGGSLTVDGTVAVTNADLTTIAGAVRAEDAASADGHTGIPAMAVRKATPANTSGADGDYENLQVSAGRLWASATIDAALPAGTNAIGKLAANSGVTIGAVEIAAAQTLGTVTTVSTVSTLTGGAIAHDGADSGNPVKVGARAADTLSNDTMVANGDRTDAVSDLDGALVVRDQFPLGDLISEAVSNTDGSSTAFSNFGAVASTRSYVSSIVAFRTDAGTSVAYVDFRDGTAGSVLFRVPLPPNGGAVLPASSIPYFRTSANTALAFDVSSALTTVYISVTGFKSKV